MATLTNRLAGISLALLLIGPGCTGPAPGSEPAKTEIYVLVDLSGTWHTPADQVNEAKNRRLLQEIGEGIALSTDTSEPPILVQHRIIGANSLDREPACSVTYMPTLVSIRSDPNRLSSAKKLRAYLGVDCPRVLLGGPAEPDTEISAAIASVATRPSPPGAQRFMIIASDFKEEAVSPEPLNSGSLARTKILLLYRPVVEDRRKGGEMQTRIESWRSLMHKLGATNVTVAPDAGFGRTEVVSFLNGSTE